MKILVTGGSGFLGTHFIRRLIRDGGHDLWNIDLLYSDLLPTHDVGDVVDYLKDFDEEIDLVLHFAAPVGGRVKIEQDPMFNADSLRIDSAVFRWAVTHARTLVYPSSSAVYPVHMQVRGTPFAQLVENMVDLRSEIWYAPDEMYGFTKLAGERLALSAQQYGLNTLAIRPFSGYGAGQSFDYPVPAIARRVLLKERPLHIWGPGTQIRDFVHVDDIVGATLARLEEGVDGYQTMNIASGIGQTFVDVARLMWIQTWGGDEEDLLITADPEKPMGVYQRVGDPHRMSQSYLVPLRTLESGLREVITDVWERIAAENLEDDSAEAATA